MIFLLNIKKQDGSLYWQEHFASLQELNRWLVEEKTRSYWKPDFTTDILDLTPPPPSQAAIDAESQRRTQILALKQRLKLLASQTDLTAADIKEAIFKLIKLKVLNKELD